MKPAPPTREQLKAAADAVVEYALIALQEEFLRWKKDVNLGTAEFIWNIHTPGGSPTALSGGEPALTKLMTTLARARRTRWNDETFMVLGLDARHEHGEFLLSFELSWDELETLHPCEIAVDFTIAGPIDLN